MKRLVCVFLCFCLVGCGNTYLLEQILTPEVVLPVKEVGATFSEGGIEFPTNPQTYEEILEMMITVVENDIMSIRVPYRGDFMSDSLYPSYQYAYGEAYRQVNTTHIEYTSNTSTYVIGYRVETDGGHYITFVRSDKDFTDDEILRQNAFFREEVSRLLLELVETERLTLEMSDVEKLEEVYRFVTEYLRYSPVIYPLSYTAYGAVYERECVCQGYVALFNALVKELGFEAEGVTGTVGIGSTNVEDGHIWTKVKVGEEWIYCDPTFGDRYSYSVEEGGATYNMQYFDMSEDAMLRDRSTNRYGVNNAILVP